MLVDTLVGGRVVIDRICQGYDMTIQDQTFTCDFIIREMTRFDVILGMD